MCILAMRVIKSPIAFHLAETDNRGVGMFFAHMTEENRLSYYDLEKKDTNVPKGSITIVINSNAKVVCNRILSPLDSI